MRFFALIIALVISQFVNAQSCNAYFPFEENATFEITNYNKKGKAESIVKHEVGRLNDSGTALEAEVKMTTSDGKGKDVMESEYNIRCENGTYYMDMSAMLSQGLEAYKDMEMEMSGDALEFPETLEVGQELKDGTTEMKISANGLKMMTMKYEMTNRKVEALEKITTPAGTFECYKITYDFEFKMMVKKKSKVVLWMAKDIGMVRSENYSAKGKLENYSELTKLN